MKTSLQPSTTEETTASQKNRLAPFLGWYGSIKANRSRDMVAVIQAARGSQK